MPEVDQFSDAVDIMLSELAEPHWGHAVRPSCWSRSKTSAMNAGRHRTGLLPPIGGKQSQLLLRRQRAEPCLWCW